jgi:hypothetical protein
MVTFERKKYGNYEMVLSRDSSRKFMNEFFIGSLNCGVWRYGGW